LFDAKIPKKRKLARRGDWEEVVSKLVVSDEYKTGDVLIRSFVKLLIGSNLK
jgi:hypothetical protein